MAEELVANFTLNNTEFDALFEINAQGAYWGAIQGDINNQTDLINIVDDLSGGIDSNHQAIGEINTTISSYGNIVTHNVAEFATSAQGALADTALQPNDNITELVNNAGYITSADLPTLADLTTTEQLNAINSGITSSDVTQISTNADNISDIEDLIPSQASSSNQLADKDFVNSSISTNTANFIGTFNSVAELEAYTGTVTNNDYAFVIVTDSAGNTAYDRYKYNANEDEWLFEYELNNSSFTAAQWAAINSGITSGDVALINSAVQPSDLATVATSGNYNDLTNKPTIPTVNNPTITLTQGGATKGTFTLNQNNNATIDFDNSGASSVSQLTDVELTNLTSGQGLLYNSTTQKWENADIGGGDITDVQVDGVSVVTNTVANITGLQPLLTSANAGTDISIASGSGEAVTVSGNGSVELEDALDDGLNSVTLTGGCELSGSPTPSNPSDITTNNGDITVSPNLFRTVGTTTTQGGVTFSVQEDGSVICSGRATAYYSFYLGRADFDPSTIDKITVAINGTFNASGNIVVDKFYVYSGSTSLGSISYTTWTQSLTVDIANDYPTADNIRVYIKRNSNTDTDTIIKPMAVKGTVNKAWKPYGQITMTGTTETVTDEEGNTATAENLLAMNTYADTQELITGAVNRQLAILVLSGVENWTGSSSAGYFSLAKTNISPSPISEGAHCYCSHFVSDSSAYTDTAGKFWLGGSYLNVNYTNQGGTSSSANMTAFKNWLKSQYAAGTPVIVIYPLDTATTETVTGQTLTTIEGDNTLTISQASINNLPISANYDKKGNTLISFTNDTGYITSASVGTLTDVSLDNLSSGQGLLYNSTTQKWENATISGSGAVDSVNGQTGTVVLTASDVGALADSVTIPTKTSDLTNDSGFVVNKATGTDSLTIFGTVATAANAINIGASTSMAGGTYSIAIGNSAKCNSSSAVAIGRNTSVGSQSSSAVALGYNAKIGSSVNYSIQLGNGTNNTSNTLAVGFNGTNYQLLDGSTGLIPSGRIPIDNSTITVNASGQLQSSGGGGGAVNSVNGQTGTVVLTASDVGAITSSDIANMQTTTNLVTSVSSSSTDSQYPSAKLFYDTCGDIETAINTIRGV